MTSILKLRLYSYLCEYFPEKLLELQGANRLSDFLAEKVNNIHPLMNNLRQQNQPAYLIQEQCLQEMIGQLGPSKFYLMTQILEEEFTGDYLFLKESGTLFFEVLHMLEVSKDLFEDYPFQKEESLPRRLRYELIGHIHDCLLPTLTH